MGRGCGRWRPSPDLAGALSALPNAMTRDLNPRLRNPGCFGLTGMNQHRFWMRHLWVRHWGRMFMFLPVCHKPSASVALGYPHEGLRGACGILSPPQPGKSTPLDDNHGLVAWSLCQLQSAVSQNMICRWQALKLCVCF